MSREKKIINNSVFVFAARAVETIAGIVVAGMLARYLGVADYGVYSLVMAFVWIAIPLIGLEIPRILAVKLSRDLSQTANAIGDNVGNGVGWNLMVFCVLAVGIWVTGFFSTTVTVSYFAGLTVAVLRTLTQTVGAVFIARERMAYDTYTSLLVTFHLIVFTSIVIWLNWGLEMVFWTTVLAYFAGFALTVVLYRNLTGVFPVPVLDWRLLRGLLLGSLAFSCIQLLDQVLIYCGAFFLDHQLSHTDVALFQAPLRIFTRFMIFPMALSVAILPGISQMVAAGRKKEELTQLTDTVMRCLLLGAMFLTIFSFTAADWLIELVFGEDFHGSIVGFKILVLSTLFYFVNQFYVILCVVCNRVKGFGMIKLVELTACAGLNVLLIPRLGYLGSMWAIFFSSGFTALCGYFYFQNVLMKESFVSLLLVMLMGFAVLAALHASPFLPFFIALPGGIIAFALLLILFKIVTLREVSFVIAFVQRTPFRKKEQDRQ